MTILFDAGSHGELFVTGGLCQKGMDSQVAPDQQLTANNGHFATGMGDATHVGGCGGTPSLSVCMCERVMLVVGEGKKFVNASTQGMDNNSPGPLPTNCR